jgi:4-hydroxymandelate oxidase
VADFVPVTSAEDFRELARSRMPADVWDYIEGGSGAERTLEANRAAFDRFGLRPRVLVDVSTVDTGTAVLGAPLAFPVGVAPTAYHRLLHPDGELATARGAGEAGALYIVSMFATQSVEDIAKVATGPLWLQLYWLRHRDAVADLAGRAAAAGYRAIVLTVDTPRVGRRLRDVRNAFALDDSVQAVNLAPEAMATAHRRREGASALAVHAVEAFDPSISWADLAWLRQRSELPLLLKGILTAEDAARAVEHGVDGIVVSNHGGRQLDGAVPSLLALPEVVDAVAGACPVILDGGVRTGAEVFTALALGAEVVLVGRPVLWALAVDGGAGVAEVLRLLHDELLLAMALAGRPTLAEIDRSAVSDGRRHSSGGVG